MPSPAAFNDFNKCIHLMHLVGHIVRSNAYQLGAFIHTLPLSLRFDFPVRFIAELDNIECPNSKCYLVYMFCYDF